MASCFFLLKQFEDVLIYLNSIKVRLKQQLLSTDMYFQRLIYVDGNNVVGTKCFGVDISIDKALQGAKFDL